MMARKEEGREHVCRYVLEKELVDSGINHI